MSKIIIYDENELIQPWFLHKELQQDNSKDFRQAYGLFENEKYLIFRNTLNIENQNLSNVKYVCMIKSHQIIGQYDNQYKYLRDKSKLLQEGYFHQKDEALLLKNSDIINDIPDELRQQIELLESINLEQLIEMDRIVCTQKFMYILKSNLDYQLWPFIDPQPLIKQHRKINTTSDTNNIFRWISQQIINFLSQDYFDLKIMSYNILADNYLLSHIKRPSSLQSFEWIDFHYRSNILIKEIKQSNSDIICLQEVDHFKQFFEKKLDELGYQTLISIERQKQDYVTICLGFKKDRFELMKFHQIDILKLSELYKEKEISNSAGFICVLKEKSSSQLIIVANSHLIWDPRFDYIKFRQIYQLYQEIDEIVKHLNSENIPIFLTGDFNSKPTSCVLQYIYDQDYELIDDLDEGLEKYMFKKPFQKRKQYIQEIKEEMKNNPLKHLNFVSAYDKFNQEIMMKSSNLQEIDLEKTIQYYKIKNKYTQMNNFKNASNRTTAQNWALSNYYKHPEFTNYANDFESCLDYIFYSNNKTIKVESLLETPSLHDINNDINRQVSPNQRFPSDHFRIEAQFKVYFKNNDKIFL